MTQRRTPFFFWLVAVSILAFVLGWQLGHRDLEVKVKNFVPQISITNKEPPKDLDVDFDHFWEVFETLPQKYIDKSVISSQKLLDGAISGMVKALGDPYTAYLTEEQNEKVNQELSGTYEGVGIQLGFNKERQLIVIAPLSETPAAEAGILAGDLILKIDDEDTFDITLPEAVSKIRGRAGSKIVLTIRPEGENEIKDVELTRKKITIPSVRVEFRDLPGGEKIAILKLTRFNKNTSQEWDKAITEILRERASGVVLDVRNNPGGFLKGSVYIAAEFMGGIIVKQELATGEEQVFRTERKGRLLQIPLVVLVNSGSASASEIVAGSLQEKNRTKLVGEETFGKGTIQEVVEFEDGSGLHVTSAKWLLPSGKNLNGGGLKPDFEVELERQDLEEERDPQLDKALEILGQSL